MIVSGGLRKKSLPSQANIKAPTMYPKDNIVGFRVPAKKVQLKDK